MKQSRRWIFAATFIISSASVFTACISNNDNPGMNDDGHAKKALLIILDGWGIGQR